jgi:hypothetical protein
MLLIVMMPQKTEHELGAAAGGDGLQLLRGLHHVGHLLQRHQHPGTTTSKNPHHDKTTDKSAR